MFHHAEWYYGKELDAGNLLTKFGTYGVSLFFILSGFTLRTVYKPEIFELPKFFKSRFFRIYPLMILIIILYYVLNQNQFNTSHFLSEISGAQGLINAADYKPIWLWSIGNELVFYLVFPILIQLELFNKKTIMLLFGSLLFINFTLFANIELTDNPWNSYANPIFNLHYFLLGYLIAQQKAIITKLSSNLGKLILILSLVGFLLYPASGNKYQLVELSHRIIYLIFLTGILIGATRGFSTFSKTVISEKLLLLGFISYGIYMFHPIVFKAWTKVLTYLDLRSHLHWSISYFSIYNLIWFGGSIALTLVISWLSYRYFESRFTKKSRPTSN